MSAGVILTQALHAMAGVAGEMSLRLERREGI